VRDAGIADGSSRDAIVESCGFLHADVDKKLEAAQACDPMNKLQCRDLVPGICCKVPVASAASNATIAYTAALDKYVASCHPLCSFIACPTDPGICQPNPSGGGGLCDFPL